MRNSSHASPQIERKVANRGDSRANTRHRFDRTFHCRSSLISDFSHTAALLRIPEGLALETLPPQRAGEFYEKATSGLSASHHLQVKAALSLLYHVLSSPNPFRECLARPNSPPRKLCCATTPLRNSASSCATCVRITKAISGILPIAWRARSFSRAAGFTGGRFWREERCDQVQQKAEKIRSSINFVGLDPA